MGLRFLFPDLRNFKWAAPFFPEVECYCKYVYFYIAIWRIGRRSLALIAEKENKDLGEGKIRTLLSNLQKESFIKINKGKKGTEILEKGIEMLKSQN